MITLEIYHSVNRKNKRHESCIDASVYLTRACDLHIINLSLAVFADYGVPINPPKNFESKEELKL